MAHREVVASRHDNPKVTIMTFPTRFGLSAGPADQQDQGSPSDKPQEQQTQQQKEDAARKQAQDASNKQRTPQ